MNTFPSPYVDIIKLFQPKDFAQAELAGDVGVLSAPRCGSAQRCLPHDASALGGRCRDVVPSDDGPNASSWFGKNEPATPRRRLQDDSVYCPSACPAARPSAPDPFNPPIPIYTLEPGQRRVVHDQQERHGGRGGRAWVDPMHG